MTADNASEWTGGPRPFRKPCDLFDSSPGPSPWYLRTGGPDVPGFVWNSPRESPRSAGATVLNGIAGPVLVLDFHNYVSLLTPSALLIWHQRHVENGPTPPVMVRVLELAKLKPLQGDLDDICEAMRRCKEPLSYAGDPTCEFAIPTTIVDEPRALAFPVQLRHIDELLILCHSSAIEPHPSWERSNLALLVARPSAGGFQLYPQDWFNSAQLDYGYQWVTRVARNDTTGRIHGEGIRIAPFVLDESLKRLESSRSPSAADLQGERR